MSGGPLGGIASFGKGFLEGAKAGGTALVEGVVDLAKGGYSIATDAKARDAAWETSKQLANGAVDYAGQVYQDPAKAYRDTRDGVTSMYSAFDQARREAAARGESAEFWGKAAGRSAFEVGAMFAAPVGAASKAGAAAKAGKALGTVGKAAKAGKAVSAAEDLAVLSKAGARARAANIGKALPDMPICTQGCPKAKAAASIKSSPKVAPVRPQRWFDDIAKKSTKNPDSDTLVLGHYSPDGPSYNRMASEGGLTYFEVDKWGEVTAGMSQDEIWRINETFLEQQVVQGKKIKFSHPPAQAKPNSFFEREVEFLRDLGYRFEMRDGVWEAVR